MIPELEIKTGELQEKKKEKMGGVEKKEVSGNYSTGKMSFIKQDFMTRKV